MEIIFSGNMYHLKHQAYGITCPKVTREYAKDFGAN